MKFLFNSKFSLLFSLFLLLPCATYSMNSSLLHDEPYTRIKFESMPPHLCHPEVNSARKFKTPNFNTVDTERYHHLKCGRTYDVGWGKRTNDNSIFYYYLLITSSGHEEKRTLTINPPQPAKDNRRIKRTHKITNALPQREYKSLKKALNNKYQLPAKENSDKLNKEQKLKSKEIADYSVGEMMTRLVEINCNTLTEE